VTRAVAPTWSGLYDRARRALEDAGVASPEAEARWLVIEATGVDGPIRPDADTISERSERGLDAMVARRIEGIPLQYVLGAWAFRGVELFVDERVLIPRPETELTAQLAIDAAAATCGPVCVADLGTGSGAIALALATEVPDAEVWATDASEDALAVARANLAGSGGAAARIRLLHGDWFGALPDDLRGRLHVVVSNPPYIAESEVAALPAEVAGYEPRGALVSGPTGLEAIERIVAEAPGWLAPEGTLVVELDATRADAAVALARQAGFASAQAEPDLTGRPRVLVARRT
jgi:release factor glutamine methyltransferase